MPVAVANLGGQSLPDEAIDKPSYSPGQWMKEMSSMRRILLIFALVLVPLPALAEGWYEPPRGSDTRAALMDAIRPHAEWIFGPPIEFDVYELRVAGDVAFAGLTAQRPGGAPIDLLATPGYARGEVDTSGISIPQIIQVLYRLSGNTWVATHFRFGATDVWYSYGPICAEYRAVVGDVCE